MGFCQQLPGRGKVQTYSLDLHSSTLQRHSETWGTRSGCSTTMESLRIVQPSFSKAAPCMPLTSWTMRTWSFESPNGEITHFIRLTGTEERPEPTAPFHCTLTF